ncbi:hypothetical protein [Bacillus pumilus]|uniref:hypothetical protein n=1 Tax=Bacillus pumilus TaxID=1408 RepID=UPI00119CD114|nr:hypothetical protein [Bacillus pumilus]
MSAKESRTIMRKAASIAKLLEGNWSARMKMALDIVIIDHYLNQPLCKSNIEKLLMKGVSYRRIKKNYGVGINEINLLIAN